METAVHFKLNIAKCPDVFDIGVTQIILSM